MNFCQLTRLFFLTIVLYLTGCSTVSQIDYSYSLEVQNSIKKGIKEFERMHDKKLKFFICVRDDSKFIVCNMDRAAPGLKFLIKRTNRFVYIDNYRMPIIFESDFNSIEYKKRSSGAVQVGGYFIHYDYSGKIVYEGILF